jgi:WD40 repeat protein
VWIAQGCEPLIARVRHRKLMRVRSLSIKTSYAVAFSPNGTTCLTLARDVSLWSLASHKKAWHSHPVSQPSGRIVTLAADTGKVCLDLKNEKDGEGSNLLFSPCGQYIVDASWKGILTLRDAYSGQVNYQREHDGEMLCRVHSIRAGTAWIVEHSPRAMTHDQPPADAYFTLSTWPLPDSTPIALGIRLPFICSSAASEDGSRLAVLFGAPPRDLRVYELPSERIVWQAEVEVGGTGGALRWSPCGRFLASVQSGCITHYSGESGDRLSEFPLPFPSDAAYSPDSRLIALGSWQSGEVRPLTTP